MTQPEIRLCPIASGSSGNCTYCGTSSTHLLIDAGISGKRVDQGLDYLGVQHIDGILITHEHSDHVSGVGVLARRHKVPLYASEMTWRYLLRHNVLGRVDASLRNTVKPGHTFEIGDMRITPFDVPHDASQPIGYNIQAGTRKVSVATDLGHAAQSVIEHMKQSHAILIESNHDVDMLANGPYPPMLKDRVSSNVGHLSNAAAGLLLSEVAWESLEYVFLGHMSEENNLPLLALDTVQTILMIHKAEYIRLLLAERHGPSEPVVV